MKDFVLSSKDIKKVRIWKPKTVNNMKISYAGIGNESIFCLVKRQRLTGDPMEH